MSKTRSAEACCERDAFEILRSLRRILRRTSEYSRQTSRLTGLSVPQLLCLKAIGEAGQEEELTAALVAQRVQLSSPTVTRIVDRLELAGFVARQRMSKDRRKICLSVTELGRQRLQKLPIPLDEQFFQRLQVMEAADRANLLQALQRIVEMMDADQIDAAPMLTAELEVRPAE